MLTRLKRELDQLAQTGLLRAFSAKETRNGAEIEFRGRRAVDFTNWDYLGLNDDKRVRFDAQAEIARSGLNSSAPRFPSGTTLAHTVCESRIAKFFGTEASVLFSSKNQALLSLVTALASERDVILSDELSQNPISDAAYLVHSPHLSFQAADLKTLDEELEKSKHYSKKIIFVDSLSPVLGNSLNFHALSVIARRHTAVVVVDESYALSAIGLRGAGVTEDVKGEFSPLCIIGSLGLGIPGYGAFIAGPNILISYLINYSRTFTTEPAFPAPIARGIESAIDLVELGTSLRQKIIISASAIRSRLREIGVICNEDTASPILSVSFPKMSAASEFTAALFQKGFLWEAVPRGTSLNDSGVSRAIVTIRHTEKHIEGLSQAISDIWKKLR